MRTTSPTSTPGCGPGRGPRSFLGLGCGPVSLTASPRSAQPRRGAVLVELGVTARLDEREGAVAHVGLEMAGLVLGGGQPGPELGRGRIVGDIVVPASGERGARGRRGG